MSTELIAGLAIRSNDPREGGTFFRKKFLPTTVRFQRINGATTKQRMYPAGRFEQGTTCTIGVEYKRVATEIRGRCATKISNRIIIFSIGMARLVCVCVATRDETYRRRKTRPPLCAVLVARNPSRLTTGLECDDNGSVRRETVIDRPEGRLSSRVK